MFYFQNAQFNGIRIKQLNQQKAQKPVIHIRMQFLMFYVTTPSQIFYVLCKLLIGYK